MRVAIIPARGGSKRIPRKNIRLFHGRPIIAYAIETARASDLFDELMVSTDDPEIAAIARNCGASVPFMRSAVTSDDHATTSQVLIEVLELYAARGMHFETGCCIYPTAPFITVELLIQGYRLLDGAGFSSVMPVTAFSYTIWRSLQRTADGRVTLNWPENLNVRSQDLPAAYHDAGMFYWFRTSEFLREGALMGSNCGSIVVPSTCMQDIDTPEDWEIAELKFERIAT